MRISMFVICLLGALTGCKSASEETSIFPKGEKAPNVHHVGNVWLSELNPADSVFRYGTSVAISDPDARLNWHVHPGGQVLIVTEGVGYYQERNKAKRRIKKGDVIKCLPGVEHWHGATPDQGVTYIATSPSEKGKTVWLEKVTDEQYYGKK